MIMGMTDDTTEAFLAGFESGVQGMYKEAVDPISMMAGAKLLGAGAAKLGLTGLGTHVASNLAGKFIRSKVGRGFSVRRMETGLRRGMKGRRGGDMTRGLLSTVVGPEAHMSHDIGKKMGASLHGMSSDKRKVTLELYLRQLNKLEGKQLPHIENLKDGIKRVLKEPEKKGVWKHIEKHRTLDAGKAVSKNEQRIGRLLGASTAVAHPSAAAHYGLNAGRELLSESRVGKKFLQRSFDRGVEGKIPSKFRQHIFDAAVSPAALDTNRAGQVISDMSKKYDIDPDVIRKAFGNVKEQNKRMLSSTEAASALTGELKKTDSGRKLMDKATDNIKSEIARPEFVDDAMTMVGDRSRGETIRSIGSKAGIKKFKDRSWTANRAGATVTAHEKSRSSVREKGRIFDGPKNSYEAARKDQGYGFQS